MNIRNHISPAGRLLPCLAAVVFTTSAGQLFAAGLTARWSLDETSAPYADSGPNGIALDQDEDTSMALTGPGIAGNAAELNYADPGPATRLFATGAALQTDSFGFSLWINPISLNAGDVIIAKEMAFDDSVENWRRQAWQIQVLESGKLELIVRGDDRGAGDFFGAVQSSVTLTLGEDMPDWIHVAGGYDSVSGALSLYVNGAADYAAGVPGATSSDGSPLVLGTQRNGEDFVNYAAGTQIDEVQLYDAPLTADEVAFLKSNPAKTIAERTAPNLAAHWKLDEPGAPYASSASAPADLLLDPETELAGSESPSLIGNAAVLRFGEQPYATRLSTDAEAVQTDSFGFSFWLRPDFISAGNVFLMKECADVDDPDYARYSWSVSALGDDGSGAAPLQLVVRGSDRTTPEPFFGEVTSGAHIPFESQSDDWIHVSGGYDSTTGAMALYVRSGAGPNSADSKIAAAGADNSDGSPLSIGTAMNGEDYIGFAAGAAIDDVQIYDGLLSFSQTQTLFANPGVTLAATQEFKILAFSHDAGSGGMSVTFESADAATYDIEASVALSDWVVVKSVTATAPATTVNVSKAELDAALGATARSAAFLRVARP